MTKAILESENYPQISGTFSNPSEVSCHLLQVLDYASLEPNSAALTH